MKPTRSDHVSDEELARRGLSRETELVLTERGEWLNGGQPVDHPGIAAAFARWIERNDAGRYALRNDMHYVYVTVEGAPLHARAAGLRDGAVWLELLGDVEEKLDPTTLCQDADGVLYARGRDGTWPIRFAPEAALALEPLLEEHADGIAIRIGRHLTPIPTRDDPLAV